MEQINNKEYDKNNNDTYTHRYSKNMAQDVEAHMFQNQSGSFFKHGLLGDFTAESAIAAQNNVLHFPKASSIGLKAIKNIQFKTLVPYSLMKRYESELYSIEYTQKTPVFFDVEKEVFVLCMDERVLRDLPKNSIFERKIKSIDGISIKEAELGSQILIEYKTLAGLIADEGKIYGAVKTAYMSQMLEFYPTEDVIITTHTLKSDVEPYFRPKAQNKMASQNDMKNIELSNANIGFSFFKAKKLSDTSFFIYDEDGSLNTSQILNIDKAKIRKENKELNESSKRLNLFLSEMQEHNISKFNEDDWNALMSTRDSLQSIFKDLELLLLKQKTSDKLDNSISEIELDNHMRIEFNSRKSIGFKK